MYYYIIDCGSTGSRVYEFKKQHQSIIQDKIYEFGPIIFLLQFYSIPQKFQKEKISDKLIKLFKLNICIFITLLKKKMKTPCTIYFGLTGGVRKFIKENKNNKNIIGSFDIFFNCLKQNSNKKYQILYDQYYMKNSKECYLEYISCSYLTKMHSEQKPTGVIGIGGSSIQISFNNGSKCLLIPFSENIGYDQVRDKLLYSDKHLEKIILIKLKKKLIPSKLKGIFYGTEAFYYIFKKFNLHNKTYTKLDLLKIISKLNISISKKNNNKVKINLLIIRLLVENYFDSSSLFIIKTEFGIKNKLSTSWCFGKFIELSQRIHSIT